VKRRAQKRPRGVNELRGNPYQVFVRRKTIEGQEHKEGETGSRKSTTVQGQKGKTFLDLLANTTGRGSY